MTDDLTSLICICNPYAEIDMPRAANCPVHGTPARMTPTQERHLERIKTMFEHLVDHKYRRGAIEHGGSLTDMSTHDLIDNAIAECIDQFTYLVSLKERL